MARNRQAHHNLSLTMANYNSTSTKSSKITILYTYKETKVRRYAPVEIPMNAFNKDKGELKRGFDEKLPTQNKWIQKFKSCKNDLFSLLSNECFNNLLTSSNNMVGSVSFIYWSLNHLRTSKFSVILFIIGFI